MSYVMVFLGAGIGGALRHGVNSAALRLGLTGFPFHTLFINAAGSLAMGVIAGWFALRGQAPQLWRLFLTTGVLGGFTTFSAFSLETVLLWERGEAGAALAYVAASVVAAIAGLVAGLWIIRAMA
ncbi:MAG TPA: fluoride efflux transporter CrcB [Enterovirga sp.]|jgi:CrcB protein|nr:fluoride efflux transporter CrcB [Enterovirga sp.]